MRHSRSITPQFFVTAPQPCPYLEGRFERKLFTSLQGEDAEALNDELSRKGFRRSQNVLYRPACADCSACMSVRIKTEGFTFTRNQRKILKKNKDLTRSANAPWATEEQFELFSNYLNARHTDGGMTDMDIFEFAAMIEETPVRSRVMEYRDADDVLVAVCLTDVLDDGLSMVYSFYRPDMDARSLGRFMILDHLRFAQDIPTPHIYLGYWVPGSPKMDYKVKFKQLEIFHYGSWQPHNDSFDAEAKIHPLSVEPIADQVSALMKPGQTAKNPTYGF